ncbi:MAG: hypothetical protein POELPBGB_03270 [Bacteroidia bacterium]|nr:hypothetical protein [Bacteroidia bacterium]
MKSVLLFLVFLSTGFSSKSQIWIGQLYQGQSINQVIYNGTYSATGNCSGQDYDFDLQYEMISPFATGVELMLEITSLGGALTLNGNAVTEGNTYPLTEPAVPVLFQFTGSGSVDFSVHASGTPTIAVETYPCYVVDKVSQFACNNTYKLMEGEVFVPCTVAVATEITENNFNPNIFFSPENQLLFVETENENELIVTDVLGKIILSQQLTKGKHSVSLPQLSNGVYIARLESENIILKFIKS